MQKLEKSIELTREKHKAKEELTFEELVDAIEILYRTTQETADEKVIEVAKKNVPYLKKKFTQNITEKYEKALVELQELELFNKPESKMFSGILNFDVFFRRNTSYHTFKLNKKYRLHYRSTHNQL